MKYWLYLVAKVLFAFGIVYGLEGLLVRYYPAPPPPLPRFGPPPPLFMHEMLFTFMTLGIGLIGAGLFALVFWDQRRRCRTCLRKLVMPVHRGSWGHMVIFGRPQTELICKFGHGTLSIDELQITGRQMPDWQPHDGDIWKELESYYQTRK